MLRSASTRFGIGGGAPYELRKVCITCLNIVEDSLNLYTGARLTGALKTRKSNGTSCQIEIHFSSQQVSTSFIKDNKSYK